MLSRLAKTALARALDRMSALRAFLFDSGARSDSRTTACKKAGKESMSGPSAHGALTLAMKYPGHYQSLSAFAPIANPTASDWGRKQLGAYLGADETLWTAHDATVLVKEKGWAGDVLIDQQRSKPRGSRGWC